MEQNYGDCAKKTGGKPVKTLHKLHMIIITWSNTTSVSSECIF